MGSSARNGHLADRAALELDAEAWATASAQSRILGAGPSSWTVSSVNPPVADKFAEFLESKQVARVTWYRAASEISVPFDVEGADTGGADRALAVFAALRLTPAGRPGLVVSCGTAITVERVTSLGVWQGGAIAPGLGTVAAALHLRTAQLPLIDVRNSTPITLRPRGAVERFHHCKRASSGERWGPFESSSHGRATTSQEITGLSGPVEMPRFSPLT